MCWNSGPCIKDDMVGWCFGYVVCLSVSEVVRLVLLKLDNLKTTAAGRKFHVRIFAKIVSGRQVSGRF